MTRFQRTAGVASLLAAVLLLAGCGSDIRKQFGLARSSPDEFRVVSRAPLTMPPDFSLRPPEPGARRPQEGSPTDQARQTVFRIEDTEGESAERERPDDGRSQGESALARAAGADQADPEIRQVVERETREINEADESLVEDLIFWRTDEEQPGEVVDPAAESRRLRAASAMGETPTGEGVPVIEKPEQTLFEKLF